MSAYLTNGNYEERWTCPECHHDHHSEVGACDGCGVKLRCTIKMEPVAYCYIDDETDDNAPAS